ncbi:MAG: glycerophosphodiester phosphodiesterase [Kofleriaceae bacterium]
MATRWHRRARPRVWAHRGDSAHVTENTLAAFASARAAGADGLEFDVRLDGDGVPVVFHDDDLRRLADRAEAVEALSSTARAAVRLRGDHAIPTLAETIAEFGDLDLNVELKPTRPGRGGALAAAVARVLADAAAPDRVLVSCFDPIALAQLRRRAPHLARALLFHPGEALPLREGMPAYLLGVAAVHPEHELVTPARVQRWHRQGWAVNVWTVDDATALRTLDALGVDGVFTNDPAAARVALDG